MRNETTERNATILKSFLEFTEKNKISRDSDIDSSLIEVFTDDIHKNYKIGKFYVRGILTNNNIKIGRKKKYSRSDSTGHQERDSSIIDMFNNGIDIDEIAVKIGKTPTRVRQIIKQMLGDKALTRTKDLSMYEEAAEKIKADIKSGMKYKDIKKKHGIGLIKQLMYVLKYNAFDDAKNRRNEDIIKMFDADVPIRLIASKIGLSRDYVYMLLRGAGKQLKISAEDKVKRDTEIMNEHSKGVHPEQIAEEFDLCQGMIRMIIRKEKDNQ